MTDNLKPIYGAIVLSKDHVHYRVESIWPTDKFGQPGVPDPDQERWGTYQPSAWNDKDQPSTKRDGFGRVTGNFDDIHADVAAHPSRVGKVKWDSPVFTAPAAAFAYARRLETVGEVAARFGDGGPQEARDLHYKGRVIRCRVVEQRLAQVERVVEGLN